MNNNTKVKPKKYIAPVAIPPGETLKEILNEMEMSQKELAARLGISEKHLTQVISGKVEISRALADKLETVLGLNAMFWLDLENEYRETLKKLFPPSIIEYEEEIARSIPYAELAKQGFVVATKKIQEKVVNLRHFFGVSNLNNIPKVNAAYRKVSTITDNKYALATWIRIAELQAQNIETQKFSKNKLIKALPRIRNLTNDESGKFFEELVELLSNCGIALVIANHFSGTGIHGVTFLNSKRNKLIIQLSVRGKFADKFWFTLFHEIGHIVYDDTGEFSYIDCNEETEKEVDKLAKEILIPQERYNYFIENCNYCNLDVINNFAKDLGIHPCIIIGRLKYENYLPYTIFTDIAPKFVIK